MDKTLAQVTSNLYQLLDGSAEHDLLAGMLQTLDQEYGLMEKIAQEPGVEGILLQMTGRLASAFGSFSALRGKRILDIACGSNTSKAPIQVNSLLRRLVPQRTPSGYSTLFEPWFCRMIYAMGADPLGVDMGDLDREKFSHHRVDLGQPGALDFLPNRSFDGIQDSRLFGSPEFTAQFPDPEERLAVAREIRRQERRLLKENGIIIHSDARDLVG